MLERILRDTFLEEGTKLEAVENIDNNQNVFYEISQNDEYRPFAFLDTFNTVTESYSEGNIDQLMGFLFRFNVNDNAFWLYQQIAYSQMIKRSKNLYAILSRDKVYTLLDKDVLKTHLKTSSTGMTRKASPMAMPNSCRLMEAKPNILAMNGM